MYRSIINHLFVSCQLGTRQHRTKVAVLLKAAEPDAPSQTLTPPDVFSAIFRRGYRILFRHLIQKINSRCIADEMNDDYDDSLRYSHSPAVVTLTSCFRLSCRKVKMESVKVRHENILHRTIQRLLMKTDVELLILTL